MIGITQLCLRAKKAIRKEHNEPIANATIAYNRAPLHPILRRGDDRHHPEPLLCFPHPQRPHLALTSLRRRPDCTPRMARTS